jgi:4-hydroxy-tetrahydrodipicolinate reductase
MDRKKSWVNHTAENASELSILSIREDLAPGTHQIKYHSDVDDIDIIHTAHNRNGFALGAVMAAEYLHNKKGIYSMQDVLAL